MARKTKGARGANSIRRDKTMNTYRFRYGNDPRILGLKDPQAKRAHDLVIKALEAIGKADSQDGRYALGILWTKAKNAIAKQPKLERRKRERRIAKAAGGEAKSKSDWLKEADKWFSRFIRLRHAIRMSDGEIIVKCVTCGHIHGIKEIDNGHWVRREKHITRFDERNVAPSCKGCNRFKGGAVEEFRQYIENYHGKGTAQELLDLSEYQKWKYRGPQLMGIAEKYKAKAKALGSDDVEGWGE